MDMTQHYLKHPDHLSEKTEAQRLAAAIRRGKPLVDAQGGERNSFERCAIGCAFAGIRGHVMTIAEDAQYWRQSLSSIRDGELGTDAEARIIVSDLGFSEALGVRVNDMHYRRRLPALEIAARLERGESLT